MNTHVFYRGYAMDWSGIMQIAVFYFSLVIKLAIGFLIIVANMNWTGKTKISQMNAIDFVGNFVLGGIIGGIIYNPDITFYSYILSLLIGITLINGLNYLVSKTNFFRSFAVGCPLTLISDGKFCVEVINNKKNQIDIGFIAGLLRSMGHFSFSDLDFLQIEVNGQLTVIEKKNKGPLPAHVVLMNGTIFSSLLTSIDKDDQWLVQQLAALHITDLSQVFMAEVWQDILTVVHMDGFIQHKKLNELL